MKLLTAILPVLIFLLCLVWLASCQQECDTPIELGFLVDQSGSISSANFKKVKDFILTMIAGFTLSPQGTHIGIVKYHTNATTVITFDEFEDPDFDYKKLNATIDEGLEDPAGGETRIDLALEKANDELFSDSTKYRPFVPKILLVLTDGQQTRSSLEEINLEESSLKLTQKGVEIYGLGVGHDVSIPDLLQIVQEKDGNVFLAEDFDDLNRQVKSLLKSFCKSVCRRNVDIGFLIPTVRSLDTGGLANIKTVVSALLSTFYLRKHEGAHFGIVTCAKNGRVIMKFDDTYSMVDIRNTLNEIRLKGRKYDLKSCLKEANDNLFDVRGGVRNNVGKYLFIFGDELPPLSEGIVVHPLQNQGVKVIGMSLSSNPVQMERMRSISSRPTSIWFKTVQEREIQSAEFFTRAISESICKEKPGKCPHSAAEKCTQDDRLVHECDTDQDTGTPCPGDTKCCLRGCERKCISPVPDCFNPVEIAFLVDTSGFATPGNLYTLQRIQAFAKRLLYSFSITETGARVAIITYDEETNYHMPLGSERYFWNIEQKIDSLELAGKESRFLDNALRFIQKNVFSLKGGIRQDTPVVLVVFSAGRPTSISEKLFQASDDLKDLGVQIWGIETVAGSNASSHMANIVSEPSYLSPLSSLRDINNRFHVNFVQTVCSTKSGTCSRDNGCRTAGEDTCTVDYDCPGKEKCCPGICRRCLSTKTDCTHPMDLAFIVQNSLKAGDLLHVQTFIKDILESLEFGRTLTWIGLITFNQNAEIKLEFGGNNGNTDEEKKQFLHKQIDELTIFPGNSTDGAEHAFLLAKNRLFTKQAGSHPNELRSVIFISSGQFKDPDAVARASVALRSDIDNVLAVVSSEHPNIAALKKIVTPDQEKHVYLASSFNGFGQYEEKIATETCQKAPKAIEEPAIFIKGPRGDMGLLGQKGEKGYAGIKGHEGQPGEAGVDGEPGIKGTKGMVGITGRTGFAGPPGEVVIDRRGFNPNITTSYIQEAEVKLSSLIADELEKEPSPGLLGRRGRKGKTGPRGRAGLRGHVGNPGRIGPEGPPGPMGPRGLDGDQGEIGYVGRAGGAGQRGEAGSVGDSGMRGAKGVKGEAGEQGDAGSDGINGVPAPRGETGSTGDIGARGLKGPTGLPGSVGPPGVAGFLGTEGAMGAMGESGLKGVKGRTGGVGGRGAVGIAGFPGRDGFVGLPGFPGPAGQDGTIGRKGTRGGDGKAGRPGGPGRLGKPGSDGAKGHVGNTGPVGKKGLPGAPASDGDSGPVGEPGAPGTQGIRGDMGDIGDRGEWGINGEEGADGEPGKKGNRGTAGIRGREGEPGPKGDVGDDGHLGPPGPLNRPGEVGSPGSAGEKGTRGDAGLPGPRGLEGETGYPGEIGLPGTTGYPGNNGDPGTDGGFGPHGYQGERGEPGLPGPRGHNGLRGEVGKNGDLGAQGNPGPAGFPGLPGFPGPPGVSAPVGLTGLAGQPGNKGVKGRKGSEGGVGEPGLDGEIGDKGGMGEKGEDGVIGPVGPVGETGNGGIIGSQGVPGAKGRAGSPGSRARSGGSGRPGGRGGRGPPGLSGRIGQPGRPGKSGVPGDDGLLGPAGDPGTKGSKGKPGRRGKPGKRGENGKAGENGLPYIKTRNGVKGQKGKIGKPGTAGKPGQNGRKGVAGKEGSFGRGGSPGKQGTVGQAGPPGPSGPPGRKGPQGDIGSTGLGGIDGAWGLPGPLGDKGALGTKGTKGATGTGTLAGEVGPRGRKGSSGRKGRRGSASYSGVKGVKGDVGPAGDTGKTGVQGSPGIAGVKGKTGNKGEKGLKGEDGAKGRLGRPGEPGDFGLVGPTGLVGMKGKIGILFGDQGYKGKQGPEGNQGMQGPGGPPGLPAAPGMKGTAGTKGAKGHPTIKGKKGIPGDPGLPGKSAIPTANASYGEPGPQGARGMTGVFGLKGLKGTKGSVGLKGSSGPRGVRGTTGISGITGKSGTKGTKGDSGPTGINADKGKKGAKGKIGLSGKGSKGESGFTGPQGEPGQPGIPGKISRGLQGDPGIKGTQGKQGLPGPSGAQGSPTISFNGTTIGIRHNESFTEYFTVDLNSDISKLYFNVKHGVELYKKPDGTKRHPALTCATLHQHYPQLRDGYFWIDPNLGACEDAEYVYCYFEQNATCVSPQRNKTERKKWFNGSDGYKWFTQHFNDANTHKLKYKLDDVQLRMLQINSKLAWQTVIYHCLNSFAWSNSLSNLSIKLQGDDDFEFHDKLSPNLLPTIIEDSCQIKDGKWRRTVLEMKSEDPRNLPIRDIAVFDVDDDGEQFSLEFGMVCFAS